MRIVFSFILLLTVQTFGTASKDGEVNKEEKRKLKRTYREARSKCKKGKHLKALDLTEGGRQTECETNYGHFCINDLTRDRKCHCPENRTGENCEILK